MQFVVWVKARSWVECPCMIESAELHESYNEGSTTYSVAARYRYEYAGRHVTGNRVWIRHGYDGNEDYHNTILQELKSHIGKDRSFRCFVNPSKPSDAVLYRNLRPDLLLEKALFTFVFGGVGVGGICFMAGVRRTYLCQLQIATQHPDEPWKWDESVADGQFVPNAEWKAWTAFAVAWNVGCSIPLMSVVFQFGKGGGWEYLIILFPAFGLYAIATAALLGRQRFRFGRPTVTLRPWPYYVGDTMQLKIEFPHAVPKSRMLKAELKVKQLTTSEENPEDIFSASVSTSNIGRSIQFEFDIPTGLPRSSQLCDASSQNTARWILTVNGTDSRWDFRAVYVLAVFDRAAG